MIQHKISISDVKTQKKAAKHTNGNVIFSAKTSTPLLYKEIEITVSMAKNTSQDIYPFFKIVLNENADTKILFLGIAEETKVRDIYNSFFEDKTGEYIRNNPQLFV